MDGDRLRRGGAAAAAVGSSARASGRGARGRASPPPGPARGAPRRLGRPLKWVSSRSEGFVSDAQSRDQVLAGELALAADGRITALRVHSTSNLGAYVAPSI